MSLELNATYNLQQGIQSTIGPDRVGTKTSDVLGEATLRANPADDLNLLLGVVQEFRSNFNSADTYFQSIQSYHYDPKSIYAQADYTVNKIVKLIAGTQWNESPLGDSDFVSRYGVILTPCDKWGVKLLRGEAFRGPMAVESDLYDARAPGMVFTGNKDLKPEAITTYDAQVFYSDRDTYAAVTYFDSTAADAIVYDATTPGVVSYMNGGKQRFNGIEFEARRSLSPHRYVLGSYTPGERCRRRHHPKQRADEHGQDRHGLHLGRRQRGALLQLFRRAAL